MFLMNKYILKYTHIFIFIIIFFISFLINYLNKTFIPIGGDSSGLFFLFPDKYLSQIFSFNSLSSDFHNDIYLLPFLFFFYLIQLISDEFIFLYSFYFALTFSLSFICMFFLLTEFNKLL